MTVAEGEQYLTLQEASARYHMALSTLRYWVTVRELPRFKRGDGRVVVKASDVEARIAKRKEVRPVDE